MGCRPMFGRQSSSWRGMSADIVQAVRPSWGLWIAHERPAERAVAAGQGFVHAQSGRSISRQSASSDRRRATYSFTSIAARSPSLNRLKQIEVMKIIAPGNVALIGLV